MCLKGFTILANDFIVSTYSYWNTYDTGLFTWFRKRGHGERNCSIWQDKRISCFQNVIMLKTTFALDCTRAVHNITIPVLRIQASIQLYVFKRNQVNWQLEKFIVYKF